MLVIAAAHKPGRLLAPHRPNLTGKFKPHDDRHSHSTWLDASDVHKVLQMDRRGHAMQGMDAVYVHPTAEMRQRLCDVLEQLWQTAVAQRYELSPRSTVPLLNEILIAFEQGRAGGTALKVPLRMREGPLPGTGRGPLTCGAPLRNRTVDLLLTISTPPCTERAGCTDGTGYRTDSTGRAGSIRRAVPRAVPRAPPGIVP
jgi:hypothetical protein